MRTSEQIGKLAGALAKAQAAMKNAAFNKINPHFKNKYADLAAIRDAVIPALTAHGISVVQTTETGDGVLIVRTMLAHASGQWIASEYPIIADTNKPQAMGSAMTYARRYCLAAICGIASEEDDDAEAAQDHGSKAPEVRNMPGTTGARKAVARTDYDMLVAEMRKAPSLDALKEWKELRKADINKLPADWIDHLAEEYQTVKDNLSAKVAA